MVVHQQHRRIAARAEALAFLQGELAVGGGFAEVDAELLLQILGGAVGAAVRAQLARQVRAERDLVLADRRRSRTSCRTSRLPARRRPACRDSRRRTASASGDNQPCSSCAMASADITADCFWSAGYFAIARSISFRPSAEIIFRHDSFNSYRTKTCRALLVAADLASCCCLFACSRGVSVSARRCKRPNLDQRSISPNTMSCVPMIVTASAIMWPRAISSSAARCAKPGARIFRRYGLFAPSETR